MSRGFLKFIFFSRFANCYFFTTTALLMYQPIIRRILEEFTETMLQGMVFVMGGGNYFFHFE